MSDESNTVRIHRVLRAAPERVYRAFLDPDAMVKWLPPHGFTGKVQQMDARVGGGYRMSFTNFATGNSHSFGGEYLELISCERIRYTDRFDDPSLPGVMQTTVVLRPVSCGGVIVRMANGKLHVCLIGRKSGVRLVWGQGVATALQLLMPGERNAPFTATGRRH